MGEVILKVSCLQLWALKWSLQQSKPSMELGACQQSLVPRANEWIWQLLLLSPDQPCALIAYFLLSSLEWNISLSLPILNQSTRHHVVASNKCSHLSFSLPPPQHAIHPSQWIQIYSFPSSHALSRDLEFLRSGLQISLFLLLVLYL